jgi:hypothetical protein
MAGPYKATGRACLTAPPNLAHSSIGPHAYQMHLWAWLRHPRLSFYQYRRKHHDIPINPRKEDRIDHYDLHQRYPGVTDFLLSQQSLVTYEHVRLA